MVLGKKVAFIYLNTNDYEPPFESIPQTVSNDIELSYHFFNDTNFPLRFNAMTPRLQVNLAKMFMWQMFPGYETYIWADSQFAMQREDSAKWLLEQLGSHDIVLFKHPDRTTVKEEADFLRDRLPTSKRLMKRYKDEWLDELMETIPTDGILYASGIFAYRNSLKIQEAFKEWWYYTTRYHLNNQLSLSHAFRNCDVGMIDDDYFHCKYFTSIRTRHD